MSFAIEPEFVAKLYDDQRGCCAVSGIEFNLERIPDALVKHPFAPSIDRRRSSGGYTEDNVRLVCVAANFGMGQWGEEVFMAIARAAVAREIEERRNPAPGDDKDWYVRQREKIAAAEAVSDKLPTSEQVKLRQRVAGLKRALTMGPARLRIAAARAKATHGAEFKPSAG
jgi:hypothetical protein